MNFWAKIKIVFGQCCCCQSEDDQIFERKEVPQPEYYDYHTFNFNKIFRFNYNTPS